MVIVAAVFLGSKLWHSFGPQNDYAGGGKKDLVIQVHAGDSTTAIGETLQKEDVVRTVKAFLAAAEGNQAISSIQPGYYLLRTEILIVERQSAFDLIMHDPGNADAARRGEAFQARGDIYPIAVNLLTFDHHVPEIYADAEFHPAGQRQVLVLGLKRRLYFYGAVHRFHHAGELGQDCHPPS